MIGIFGAAVVACVVFVDTLTIGGAESTIMPVVVNGGLKLSDATFVFRWSNIGDGVSGGGSGSGSGSGSGI